jgi:hypothetical protein
MNRSLLSCLLTILVSLGPHPACAKPAPEATVGFVCQPTGTRLVITGEQLANSVETTCPSTVQLLPGTYSLSASKPLWFRQQVTMKLRSAKKTVELNLLPRYLGINITLGIGIGTQSYPAQSPGTKAKEYRFLLVDEVLYEPIFNQRGVGPTFSVVHLGLVSRSSFGSPFGQKLGGRAGLSLGNFDGVPDKWALRASYLGLFGSLGETGHTEAFFSSGVQVEFFYALSTHFGLSGSASSLFPLRDRPSWLSGDAMDNTFDLTLAVVAFL